MVLVHHGDHLNRIAADPKKANFMPQFTSRFALLDPLSENRQLLIHGGTGTGKTWHALELAFRHARQGACQRVYVLDGERKIHYAGAPGSFAELTAEALLSEAKPAE